jgi:hypothetical protein
MAAFRTGQYQQLLMQVDPYPWRPISWHAVADRRRVATEHTGRQPNRLTATLRNIDLSNASTCGST